MKVPVPGDPILGPLGRAGQGDDAAEACPDAFAKTFGDRSPGRRDVLTRAAGNTN